MAKRQATEQVTLTETPWIEEASSKCGCAVKILTLRDRMVRELDALFAPPAHANPYRFKSGKMEGKRLCEIEYRQLVWVSEHITVPMIRTAAHEEIDRRKSLAEDALMLSVKITLLNDVLCEIEGVK